MVLEREDFQTCQVGRAGIRLKGSSGIKLKGSSDLKELTV